MYLVLIPFVLSAVSPLRKAKVDGASCAFAILTMLSHCSTVAKWGKYSARGFQLKIYIRKFKTEVSSTAEKFGPKKLK